MKKLFLFTLSILFLITGCSKEDGIISPAVSAIIKIAPQVFTGSDFQLLLPVDSATLKGSLDVSQEEIFRYNWRKIAGPSSYVIENPQSLQTKISKLERGRYSFELMLLDDVMVIAKDTVTIDVNDRYIAAPNEMAYHNLEWQPIWYNTLEVKNIYPEFSVISIKKVFIQRLFDPAWIEVPHHSIEDKNKVYEYFIETRPGGAGMYHYGSLYIFYYGTNVSDKPQVKIVF